MGSGSRQIDPDDKWLAASSSSEEDQENPTPNKKNLDDVLPKGAPGRKSFSYLPGQKRKFWREEALALRRCFQLLMPVHFGLLFVDWIIYDIEYFSIFLDVVFLWLSFYNFMTLNKIMMIAQIGIYLLAVVISISHLKRIFMDPGWHIPVFLLQYLILYPASAAILLRKFKAHYNRQMLYKREKKMKTAKGRLKLRVEKVAKKRAGPIIKNKFEYLLGDPSSDESEKEDKRNKKTDDIDISKM